MATYYGINMESILNSSTHLHVDGLPPDMHDVLEGALPYEIKVILGYYLQNHYINVRDKQEASGV